MNKKNTIRVGFEGTNHLFKPENSFRSVTRNVDSTQVSGNRTVANEFNVYVEDEWQWKKWQVDAGLRGTLYNVNGVTYSSLQPRLDAQYKLNGN